MRTVFIYIYGYMMVKPVPNLKQTHKKSEFKIQNSNKKFKSFIHTLNKIS